MNNNNLDICYKDNDFNSFNKDLEKDLMDLLLIYGYERIGSCLDEDWVKTIDFRKVR